MHARDNGEVESESDKSESEEMLPLVNCSDEEIAYPDEFFQFFREPRKGDYPTNTQQVRQKKFIDLKIG
jgi:hypothetical protein